MKYTPFNAIHREAGAKMVEFAGYEMPLEYSGVNDEHVNVRNHAGIFDISHMGEFWVKGPRARDFVQKVTTNDVDKLYPGKVQYSCLPNGKGGVVDDLLVYHYEEQKYLLVVNAANTLKDWEWLNEVNDIGAELEDSSDDIAQLAVQGPASIEILQKLADIDLSALKFYTFTTGTLAGMKDVIISNTGYTGAGGFELYFYNKYAETIWDKIMEAGKPLGIKPAGLAARDTLRLEMGFCLYGNDIDDSTSPIEAGLGWITKFNENNNFIDKERLFTQKKEGVGRKLVGFEMVERAIPRQHYSILNEDHQIIGEVTSGTMSPILKKGIGMGYVEPQFAAEGTGILIAIRNKKSKAKIVRPPFIK